MSTAQRQGRFWLPKQLVRSTNGKTGQLLGHMPPVAYIPHRYEPLVVVQWDADAQPECIRRGKVWAALDGPWGDYVIDGPYARSTDASVRYVLEYQWEKYDIFCAEFGRGVVDETLVRIRWENGEVWRRVPPTDDSELEILADGTLEMKVYVPPLSVCVWYPSDEDAPAWVRGMGSADSVLRHPVPAPGPPTSREQPPVADVRHVATPMRNRDGRMGNASARASAHGWAGDESISAAKVSDIDGNSHSLGSNTTDLSTPDADMQRLHGDMIQHCLHLPTIQHCLPLHTNQLTPVADSGNESPFSFRHNCAPADDNDVAAENEQQVSDALREEECYVDGKLAHIFLQVPHDADSDAVSDARQKFILRLREECGPDRCFSHPSVPLLEKACQAMQHEQYEDLAESLQRKEENQPTSTNTIEENADDEDRWRITCGDRKRYPHDILCVQYQAESDEVSQAFTIRKEALEDMCKKQGVLLSDHPDCGPEFEQLKEAMLAMRNKDYAEDVRRDGVKRGLPVQWTVDGQWAHQVLGISHRARMSEIDQRFNSLKKEFSKAPVVDQLQVLCAHNIMINPPDASYPAMFEEFNGHPSCTVIDDPNSHLVWGSGQDNGGIKPTSLRRSSGIDGNAMLNLPCRKKAIDPPVLPKRQEGHEEAKKWYLRDLPMYGPHPETLMRQFIVKSAALYNASFHNPLDISRLEIEYRMDEEFNQQCRTTIVFSFTRIPSEFEEHEFQVTSDWVAVRKDPRKAAVRDAAAEALALFRVNPSDYGGDGYKGARSTFPEHLRIKQPSVPSGSTNEQMALATFKLPPKGCYSNADVERAYRHFLDLAEKMPPTQFEKRKEELLQCYQLLSQRQFPEEPIPVGTPMKLIALQSKNGMESGLSKAIHCYVCPDKPIVRPPTTTHLDPLVHHLRGKTHLKEGAKKLWPYDPKKTNLYPSYVEYVGKTWECKRVFYRCTVCNDDRLLHSSMSSHLEGEVHLINLARKIATRQMEGFSYNGKVFIEDYPSLR